MNVIRKDATITNTDETFPGSFEVVLSAPTKDRDGDTLLPDEWKQPLPDHITFDSDHGMSVATTVGSGVPRIDEETGNLVVAGTYSSLDRAQEVRTLVNEGHIRTTSVAFMSEKSDVKDANGKTVKQAVTRELLNGAFVAIPSNREALVLSSKSIPTPAQVFGEKGAELSNLPVGSVIKAGARNSTSDMAHIQAIHDHALALGAVAPADDTGAAYGTTGGKGIGTFHIDVKPRFDTFKDAQRLLAHVRDQFPDELSLKSIEGSLEAKQDRISDALQDANPDSYVWLRGTLDDYVVFECSEVDGPESETYKQTYTDDGSVVTLTGEKTPVDLAEVVTPDPDSEADASEAPAEEKDALSNEIDLKYRALMIKVASAIE